MLPENYKAKEAQKVEFDPLPEDIYQVEIADAALVDAPVYKKPDETEELINFEFVVLDEGQFRGRRLWKKVRPVINEGGNGFKASFLYELMCKAMKIQLKKQEALDLAINVLLGKQLVVAVDAKPGKNDKVWNNIRSFTQVKDMLEPFEKSEVPKTEGTVAPTTAREMGPAGKAMVAGGAPVPVSQEQHPDPDAEIRPEDIPF